MRTDGQEERGFPAIRGLHDYWSRATRRTAQTASSARADRILLDLLGLGLGQALSYLAQTQPTFEAFLRWTESRAGIPDPVAVSRYHAWLDGAPSPAAARARLAAIEAMPPVLGTAELRQWDCDGYVVVRGAIAREDAEAAAALLWRSIGADPGDPDSWYRARTDGVWVPCYQHAALEVARRSPRVHRAFAQLWGTPDLWMRVDQLGFNPPEIAGKPFQGSPLHWDVSLAQPIPFATQALLYLNDTPADQGAFRLVPGFHHRLPGWLDALGDIDPRSVDLSGGAQPVPGGAGDLVIWRQDLPHGASPNRGRAPRLVQYLTMYSPDLVQHAEWR